MINQFTGNAVLPPPPPSANSQIFSDEKTARLNEILSEYDAENLSEDEAQSIVSQISELGIDPGAGLTRPILETSFSAQLLRNPSDLSFANESNTDSPLSSPNSYSSTPATVNGFVNREAMMALDNAIAPHKTDTLTTDNWTEIRTSLTAQGFDLSQPLMDIRA